MVKVTAQARRKDMHITKTIKAGAKGSRRFLEQWGHQLVAVRYRKDERQQRTLTTI